MKNFRDLQVWHKAHALTLTCYQMTSAFPETRSVWVDQPDPSMCSFNRRQHR